MPRPGYSLQPDVLVARRSELTRQRLEHPPVLVVEVISPSSRTVDRTLKRAVYEEFGVRHYWIVDPEMPSLVALDLQGSHYREVASVEGTDTWHATRPFDVDVTPVCLLDE